MAWASKVVLCAALSGAFGARKKQHEEKKDNSLIVVPALSDAPDYVQDLFQKCKQTSTEIQTCIDKHCQRNVSMTSDMQFFKSGAFCEALEKAKEAATPAPAPIVVPALSDAPDYVQDLFQKCKQTSAEIQICIDKHCQRNVSMTSDMQFFKSGAFCEALEKAKEAAAPAPAPIVLPTLSDAPDYVQDLFQKCKKTSAEIQTCIDEHCQQSYSMTSDMQFFKSGALCEALGEAKEAATPAPAPIILPPIDHEQAEFELCFTGLSEIQRCITTYCQGNQGSDKSVCEELEAAQFEARHQEEMELKQELEAQHRQFCFEDLSELQRCITTYCQGVDDSFCEELEAQLEARLRQYWR